MSKKLLPDIHRKIVNAKYVLEQAATFQLRSDEMSLAISLLLMHDAIEMLQIAILDHLGTEANPNRQFKEFWSQIKLKTGQVPPDFIPMESLNKLRINLKHYANLPNPKSVRELLPRARGFFENVLQAYCQITYFEISLVDLIPDPEVRSILVEARNKFSSGDKASAMTDLKFAFRRLQHPEGSYLPMLHAPKKPSMPSEMERAGWGTYMTQLHSFLDQCASRTNALMLGVDPIRYADFLGTGPAVLWSITGKPSVQHWRTYEEVDLERFDELVSFLIDYALKVGGSYIRLTERR